MDANISNGSNEVSSSITKKVCCRPLSGEGLPYAPVDWPNEGDIWGWKVGTRFDTTESFFQDRYLIVPKRLQPHKKVRLILRSKISVKHFLQSEFPDADVGAFFASFSWKVPVTSQLIEKTAKDTPSPCPRKSTKQEAIALKCAPSPRPQKSIKKEASTPKDAPSPHPWKSAKKEIKVGGTAGTREKLIQKHVIPGQRTRRSSRLMGKFKTKYAGTLFDLTLEDDGTDV